MVCFMMLVSRGVWRLQPHGALQRVSVTLDNLV
jgi:hypothetical protein